MGNTDNSFRKLLEQYTFTVAGRFIEQAKASTQSDLIQFLYQIDAPDDPAGVSEKASVGPAVGKESDRQWLARLMQARSRRYEQHIRFLQHVILQTEAHLNQIQRTPGQEPQRSRTEDWYKVMLRFYRSQLSEARIRQQPNANPLRHWQG
ncbi:hypothetical protein [Spirosoma koreense]